MPHQDAPEAEPETPPPVTSDLVSTRITVWLDTHDRTQAWLARRLNVREMWVRRRISGRTPWLVDDLQHVAVALDIPPADLISAPAVVANTPAPFGRTLGTDR